MNWTVTDLSPENVTYPRFSTDHAEAYAPVRQARFAIDLDDDFFDRAAREAKDAVLRHREAQRVRARQAGIEATQDSGHDAVADLSQPSGDASGKRVVALAVGGVEIPFELFELRTDPGADISAIEPIPR